MDCYEYVIKKIKEIRDNCYYFYSEFIEFGEYCVDEEYIKF